jgi:ABC-type bacteriocin/lantibiotic exporter with double-glycine peptidase domain
VNGPPLYPKNRNLIGALFRGRLLIVFLLVLSACSHHETRPLSGHIIDVPFYPQEKDQCGPAALASVLAYWQGDESPAEIASTIFSKSAGGVLGIDLENYAAGKGYRTRQYSGGLPDLMANIDSGHPLIILVDTGIWVVQGHHFMTVVGYDDSAVFAHSGREKWKRIENDELISQWRKTDFWTLLILPPEKGMNF